MSENTCGTAVGRGNGGESTVGPKEKSARIRHTIWWCVTSEHEGAEPGFMSGRALAHTFAVCMLEYEIMARGAKKDGSQGTSATMPKFIDIKLTAEDRAQFLQERLAAHELVGALTRLCDNGYRVGCQWSGETQSYTVSLTCRNPDDPNNGFCMTSFAKTLDTAVALAVFKHTVVADTDWTSVGSSSGSEFG